jgi:hypothetical protein
MQENLLNVGQWVSVQVWKSTAIGFIEEVNLEEEKYLIYFVRTKSGHRIEASQ